MNPAPAYGTPSRAAGAHARPNQEELARDPPQHARERTTATSHTASAEAVWEVLLVRILACWDS